MKKICALFMAWYFILLILIPSFPLFVENEDSASEMAFILPGFLEAINWNEEELADEWSYDDIVDEYYEDRVEEEFVEYDQPFQDDEVELLEENEILWEEPVEEPANEILLAEDTESFGEFELVGNETFEAGSGITITKQPEDASAALGQYATVTVEAEGENLSYQWYYKTVNGTAFKTSSAKTNTYSVKMGATQVGMQLYCKISNGTDSVDSNIVTLSLPAIVSEPFMFKKIDGTNNLALIGYTGNDASIRVPGSVDGMIVTEIGLSPLPEGEKGVFEGNTTLISVELPNSITAIREKAFKGCTNLSSMTTY